MTFGLTVAGFLRKREADIFDSLAARLAPIFGVTPGSAGWPVPNSPEAQFIGGVAAEMAEDWEALEALYFSADPEAATAAALDHQVSLNLISRLAATATAVRGAITGTLGVVVPAGNRAQMSTTKDLFEALADATIDKDVALQVTITVSSAVNSTSYTVTVKGTPYTITSAGSGATAASIALQLVTALAAASAIVSVVNNLDGSFVLTAADFKTAFSSDVGARLVLSAVYSPQDYEAVSTGPLSCPTGTLDTIANPVAGFSGIKNLLDGTLGTNIETDTALRVRRRVELAKGKGTVNAIRAFLLSGNVVGVTQAFVYENILDVADGAGRPPHSIEALVLGGADGDIALAIHRTRAGGIQTFGNVNSGSGVAITDDQGFAQVVKFSRPVPKYVWIQVHYTLYSEEAFPADGEAQIIAKLIAYGETLTVGNDLLIQRLESQAFLVSGLARVTVTAAVTADLTPPGSYAGSDIAIGQTEILVFDSARVTFI